MTVEEIEKAIEVLNVCKVAFADMVANDGEVISDYDAITQVIRALKEYKDSKKKIKLMDSFERVAIQQFQNIDK